MHHLAQPKLTPFPTLNRYGLLEDYLITYQGLHIRIPKEYYYDGATVPWFGWLITYTPFHPDVMQPSLIHDWFFQNHIMDRAAVDRMFLAMLKDMGISNLVANMMYWAVRIMGHKYWNNSPREVQKMKDLYQILHHQDRLDDYQLAPEFLPN